MCNPVVIRLEIVQMRILKFITTLVLFGDLMSCTRCASPSTTNLLEMVPAESPFVVTLSDLGNTSADLNTFLTRAAGSSGESLKKVKEALTQQLTADFFDPQSYEQAGIVAQSGAVLFSEKPDAAPIVLLQISDPTKFEKTLAAIVQNIDGANERSEQIIENEKLLVLGRPFGGDVVPVIYWAYHHSSVFLTSAQNASSIAHTLTRLRQKNPTNPSMVTNQDFQTLRAKFAPGGLFTYIKGNAAQALRPDLTLEGNLASSTTLGGQGFSSRFYIRTPSYNPQKLFAATPTQPLLSRVADNTVAVALSNVTAGPLFNYLESLPNVQERLGKLLGHFQNQSGLDLKSDLLPLLKGPLTASLHVVDLEQLAQKIPKTRSARGFLDVVHFSATAQITDHNAMLAALDKSREQLKKRGVVLDKHIEKIQNKDVVFYEPQEPQPRLGWALVDDLYVYGAGIGRLRQTVEMLVSGGSALPTSVKGSLLGAFSEQPNRSIAAFRLKQISDLGRAMSGSTGSAVAAGALLGSLFETMRTLGDVVVSLSGDSEGVWFEVQQKFL